MKEKESLLREWDIETLIRVVFLTQLDNVIDEHNQNEYLVNKKKLVVELEEYIKLITKESDRGLILIIAGYLDHVLEEVLFNKLIGSKKIKKKALDLSGPLGTFSSRILLSYSIGLISKKEYVEINKIRDIRNTFAHSKEIINFQCSSIDKEFNGITLYPKNIENIQNREKLIFSFSILLGKLFIQKYSKRKLKELDFELLNLENYYGSLQLMTKNRR